VRVPEPVSPDAVQPLRDLWRRYGAYRTRFVGAVAASTLNKVADVVPELLIGAAVDVVVRGDASFVGEVLGVESRFAQLGWLAVINAVVWLVESVSEYVASVLWRGLAQGVEHDLRVEAYDHVQHLDLGWHESRPAGSTLATLNDDVNQLERFLDVGAPHIILTATSVVAVGAVFVVISPVLALLAFLPIPVIVGGSLLFQRRLGPRYQRVRLDFKLRLRDGFPYNFYRNELEQALIRALSPWAFDPVGSGGQLDFGGRLYRSVLLDFVEELPYVDFVTDFRMGVTDGVTTDFKDVSELAAEAPDVIFVSDAQHTIAAVTDKEVT
jgi:ABC-type multidrug transport system fused ATPase/permease subunit